MPPPSSSSRSFPAKKELRAKREQSSFFDVVIACHRTRNAARPSPVRPTERANRRTTPWAGFRLGITSGRHEGVRGNSGLGVKLLFPVNVKGRSFFMVFLFIAVTLMARALVLYIFDRGWLVYPVSYQQHIGCTEDQLSKMCKTQSPIGNNYTCQCPHVITQCAECKEKGKAKRRFNLAAKNVREAEGGGAI